VTERVRAKDFIIDESPVDFLANLYCILAIKRNDSHYIIDIEADETYDVELLENTNTVFYIFI
jgi:hypothetical protein